MGLLPSSTIPPGLAPAPAHPPILTSGLLTGAAAGLHGAVYPRSQWYSYPIVQAAWVTANWYKMSMDVRRDQIKALEYYATQSKRNAKQVADARAVVVEKLIKNTEAQLDALKTLKSTILKGDTYDTPPHPINPYLNMPAAPKVPLNQQIDALAHTQQVEDFQIQTLIVDVKTTNAIEAGHAAAEKGYVDALKRKYSAETKAESDHLQRVLAETKQQQKEILEKTQEEQKMLKAELGSAMGTMEKAQESTTGSGSDDISDDDESASASTSASTASTATVSSEEASSEEDSSVQASASDDSSEGASDDDDSSSAAGSSTPSSSATASASAASSK